MKDVLSEIIAVKRIEVARQREVVTLDALKRAVEGLESAPSRSMREALATSPS